MINMKFLFLSGLALLISPSAFAVKYMCVTSPQVPSVVYEYADRFESGNGRELEISRHELRNSKDDAHRVLVKRWGDEGPLSRDGFVQTGSLKGKMSIYLLADQAGARVLEVPYVSPSQGTTASVKADDLVFDGREVKELRYIFCGKD